MFIQKIDNLKSITEINPTSFAQNLAFKKSQILIFQINQIPLSPAHILKQEALSAGGDFIVSKDMILCKESFYNGILIATQNQMERIIEKCKIQPFGLKEIATKISFHLNPKRFNPRIMGIININNDSFYEDSRIQNTQKIISKIEEMIENGIEIIDIGATSTRPGSTEVAADIELDRLKDAIKEIHKQNLTQKAIFSVDSYHYESARFCIEHGFTIINDVWGLKDMRLAKLAKGNDNQIILMHNSQITPHQANITQELDEFFTKKLEKLDSMGIKKEQVILDIGFGFGKNTQENLTLIENLAHFRHFGCEILLGASRKRTIGEITQQDIKDRLIGTISLHQIALDKGASIIRCHDFKEHKDMIAIWKALQCK